jgi:GT2 family glycosyltransferase
LDDDDLVLPGRLERQRATLRAASDSPLCFGRARIVDGAGRPVPEWNERIERRFGRLEHGADFPGILAARCPIYTSATMVRREAFLSVGGYDAALDAFEDLDLYLRLSRIGPLVPCPGGPVAEYRLHGANTRSDRLYEGALAVTAKHLGEARGRERRLLLEQRLDALWGLGRFGAVREDALRAAREEPLLLARPRFAARLAATVLTLRR